MIPVYALALVALCAYRVTRLITADTIVDPLRDWWERVLPDKLVDLLSCSFCAGTWITVGVLLVWVHAGNVGRWLVTGAAVVGVQALLSAADDALTGD